MTGSNALRSFRIFASDRMLEVDFFLQNRVFAAYLFDFSFDCGQLSFQRRFFSGIRRIVGFPET